MSAAESSSFAKGPATAAAAHTSSSVLVSSSKYLNSAVLRDWIATHTLRRESPWRVTYSDNYVLNREMARLRDDEGFDALAERERRANPVVDRWLGERWLARVDEPMLRSCRPGTVGTIYLDYIRRLGIEVNVGFRFDVKRCYDYFAMRHSQNHDFDHIVTGGPFTIPTEMVPVWAMLSNYFVHLGADLAGAHHGRTLLGSQRFLTRALLYYPLSFPKFLESIAHGIRVGLASDPMFTWRYDDVIHMTPAEARRHLGVREAIDVVPGDEAAAYGEPDPEGIAARLLAADTAAGVPYIRRGVRNRTTASSVLVGSSPWLESAAMREWVATHYLRRNGPDRPLAGDVLELDRALDALRDEARVRRLFEAEARRDDAFAGWLGSLESTPSHPAGLFERVRARMDASESMLRVLCGAGPDSLGGVVTGWAWLANSFRHLAPELASAIHERTLFATMRLLYRSMLHYPRTWPTVVLAVQQGLRVGSASERMLTMPFEDAAGLPLAEARERLGIRGPDAGLDSRAASEMFDDLVAGDPRDAA